jgi:ABC-type antimicrobial peptide transport system permease subunit
MKRIKTLLVIFSIAISVSLMAGVCSAGTAASVNKMWASTNYGDASSQVGLGSTVFIHWTGVVPSAFGDTVDVTVIDPYGNNMTNWQELEPSESGTISFVANTYGSYAVIFDGHPTYYTYTTIVAVTSFFVVPEGVLGTLMALVSGFVAVGIIGVVKIRRQPQKIKK